MKLCDYGCGQEAKHQLKNGKWCCSKNCNSCPKRRKLQSEKHRGQKAWNKNKKTGPQSEKVREMKRKRMMGDKNPAKRLEVRKKIKEKRKGQKPSKRCVEAQKKKVKEMWNDPNSKFNSIRFKDLQKSRMKNWLAVYMNSFISDPSKLQIETWKLVSKICPYVYLNFPIAHLKNSYNIDIAIPKLDIAIETDGSYWHQDKEKDLKRQEELEEDGWKFLRYIDVVPTKEQLEKDIKNLIGVNNFGYINT